MDFLKDLTELLPFALLAHKLLQPGSLQIFPVEAKMIVEHLGKDPQHCCFGLVAGAFNVDVEEDGIRMACSRLLYLLLQLRHLFELFDKTL